jgi:hypothetical protein
MVQLSVSAKKQQPRSCTAGVTLAAAALAGGAALLMTSDVIAN